MISRRAMTKQIATARGKGQKPIKGGKKKGSK